MKKLLIAGLGVTMLLGSLMFQPEKLQAGGNWDEVCNEMYVICIGAAGDDDYLLRECLAERAMCLNSAIYLPV